MLKRSSLSALGIAALALPWLSEPSMAKQCHVKQRDVLPAGLTEFLSFAKDAFGSAADGAGNKWYLGLGEGLGTLGQHFNNLVKILPGKDPDPFQPLEDQLNRVASILYEQDIHDRVHEGYTYLHDAIIQASTDLNMKPPHLLPSDATVVSNALDAVNRAWEPDWLWKRLYDECANDGGTNWKHAITPPAPKDEGNNKKTSAYEWRYMVPYVLNAIPLRLRVIEAVNPSWRLDGSFDSELTWHAEGLDDHLVKMTSGVQCGSARADNTVYPGDPPPLHINIACADVNTGLSVATTATAPISPDQLKHTQQVFKSQVIEEMPLFEMRSVEDTLHFYVSHAPDLTETWQRIPVAAAPKLCLAVQGSSAKSGTPVVLGSCQPGTAGNRWVYDREKGQISNPALNTCLTVQTWYPNHAVPAYGQPIAGTPVLSATCDGSHSQQWTYDPDTQVLSNRFGTVLDIPWGIFLDGAPVQVWDRNDPSPGPGQRWYADPTWYCTICNNRP
jgi:hypothetical protein